MGRRGGGGRGYGGVTKQTWCLTSTETLRFIWDGEKEGWGGGGEGGRGGMEVGKEEDYIPITILSPPE